MPLQRHASTGLVLGLGLSLGHRGNLERIRLGKEGNESKWFSIFASLAMAYKSYKIHQFSVKYPECPQRVLARLVTHGQEELGEFCFVDGPNSALQLLDECRLLVTCAYHVFRGNSVRYEFGLRWYYQTAYSAVFRDNFVSVLGITPVTSVGVNGFSKLLLEDEDAGVEDTKEFSLGLDTAGSCSKSDESEDDGPIGSTMDPIYLQEFEENGSFHLESFLDETAEHEYAGTGLSAKPHGKDAVMECWLESTICTVLHGLVRDGSASKRVLHLRDTFSVGNLLQLAGAYGWGGPARSNPCCVERQSSSSSVLATAGASSVSNW